MSASTVVAIIWSFIEITINTWVNTYILDNVDVLSP